VSHHPSNCFRNPSLRPGYRSVLLSAIPLGTITLGLVLSVESWTGSLSVAGLITALFTLGNLGQTAQGLLIDRVVVVAAGLVSGSALGMVALAGQSLTPIPLPLGVLSLPPV
jgi:hypothetical protein